LNKSFITFKENFNIAQLVQVTASTYKMAKTALVGSADPDPNDRE